MNAPCDDGSCAFTIDCAGNCGGTFLDDACGNCYDPISTQFSQTFELSGSVVSWSVPQDVEEITIEVRGAQGGGNFGSGGGLGARVVGTFSVFSNEELNVFVGGAGVNHPNRPSGGGASAVSRLNNAPMIVAGGGGGVINSTNGNQHGQITANGADGFSPCCFDRYGVGGTPGNGATNGGFGPCGGNGGGWFSDGQSHSGCGSIYSFGRSLLSGGEPGEGGCGLQPGGFGGGGGGGCDGAGGGGGYAGGGGSYSNSGFGGGGGSYNAGANPDAEAGVNQGDGIVIISWQIIPECIPGCTDPIACNYNANAQGDDGSCLYVDCNGICGGNFISDACGNCFDPGVSTPECIGGCNDQLADNYNPLADYNDGSCLYNLGCMNPAACNYDNTALTDDGSCLFLDCAGNCGGTFISDACGNCFDPFFGAPDCVLGCTDANACNYNPGALTDNGSCLFLDCAGTCGGNFISDVCGNCFDPSLPAPNCVLGCTNQNACNFNALATTDDGSCLSFDCNGVCGGNWITDLCGNCYDPAMQAPNCVLGCTNSNACNFDALATNDDGSCLTLDCNGVCGGSFVTDACGNCFDANLPAPACVFGCTDPSASNYDPLATNDDGSCLQSGCTYPNAVNYNAAAIVDDGSCVFEVICIVEGCTDVNALNYLEVATIDNGSCIYVGCTDSNATNYNPAATIEDGSCIISDCAYQGPLSVTFTKVNFADWTLEENQDRITDNVWLARQNTQGMFNAFDQTAYPGNAIGGPSNTEWKLGFTDQPGTYTSWVVAAQNNPNANCNGDVAWSLHIIDTDLYFDVVWHSFTGSNGGGGFSYTRTLNEVLSNCQTLPLVYGCTDAQACNYDVNATFDNGSCESSSCQGCIDPLACNFNPQASINDGSCNFDCYGCTYIGASNYNANATFDDGSCTFGASEISCGFGTFWDPISETCVAFTDCPADLNGDGIVNSADLLAFLGAFGTLCD
jgi:hypothetical protein